MCSSSWKTKQWIYMYTISLAIRSSLSKNNHGLQDKQLCQNYWYMGPFFNPNMTIKCTANARDSFLVMQWTLSWETTAMSDHLFRMTTYFWHYVQCKWTCHRRPFVFIQIQTIFMVNRVQVSRYRFYIQQSLSYKATLFAKKLCPH